MKFNIDLEKLIDKKHFNLLRDGVLDIEPADIAAMIEQIPIDKAIIFFRILPKDIEAEVFANLDPDVQKSLIERLTDAEISDVIEELFLDDAVDFVEEMPAYIAKKVLERATAETREQINRILKYPQDSAGTIMTVEYVHLKRDLTVHEAFTKIRKFGLNKETIYTCYVTDSARRMEGVVSAKTLMLSDPEQVLSEVMDTNLIFVHTDDDREKVAALFDKYDFLSIPVVDSESRIVGIITIDDIIDVVREEATEDIHKMAAMLPSDKPYLKTSVLQLGKNRITWLIVLMVTAMITGGILEKYEAAIACLPILTVFIPLLMDTSGNAGSQSATMIIRSMALGELTPGDFMKIIWKEVRAGLLVGVILSAINFIRIWITYRGNADLGADVMMISVTVSLTLLCTVVIANIVGGVLPVLAKRLKIDPAVMAAPLITSIVDALSLIIYFSLAMWFLKDLFAANSIPVA
ncbi:MAG: magnesium transporter [Oscillospiraceae bacterium]|nr:magnesium transporter [Oscillospiraceae bacterium]